MSVPPEHRRVASPFRLVPVAELRRGDLVHLGGSAYMLVADVQLAADGRAQVRVFDGDRVRPEGGPRGWTDTVPVAHRGIAAPLTPGEARRREAAFVVMDRVRGAIGPVTGVDEEIDRLRGRDPAPHPPPASTPTLPDVVAGHREDGPLLLDVDQPAVRAIVALFVELKAGEDPDGGWNGADTVDVLTCWLERIGIDPTSSLDRIDARVARDFAVARLAHVVAAAPAGEGPARAGRRPPRCAGRGPGPGGATGPGGGGGMRGRHPRRRDRGARRRTARGRAAVGVAVGCARGPGPLRLGPPVHRLLCDADGRAR